MNDTTYANEGEYHDVWHRFGAAHGQHRLSQQITVGTRYYTRYCHTCEEGMTHVWMTMSPEAIIAQVRASGSGEDG